MSNGNKETAAGRAAAGTGVVAEATIEHFQSNTKPPNSQELDYIQVLDGHFLEMRQCLLNGDEVGAAAYSSEWLRIFIEHFDEQERATLYATYRVAIESRIPEQLKYKAYGLLRITPDVPDQVTAFAKLFDVEPPSENGTPEGVGWTKYLADRLMADEHFAVDAGGALYRYIAGNYQADGERFIAQASKGILESDGEAQKWSRYRIKEVTEYIKVDAPHLTMKPPAHILNLKNGLLNLDTGELSPHTPDFMCPIQLPVEYDPDADCPAWHRFNEQVFPADCLHLPFELAAWLMTPALSFQHAVLLLGDGENGKSTFLAALKSFLGKENVVSLSLQKLESNNFATARLVGKLANICPDLPSDHLTSTSMFKALTGDDPIHAERKHQSSFEFESFAKLVFSANHPPRSSDSSKAFFRRWLVVPFDRTFSGEKQIPRHVLDAQLADPKELSGVLNMALIALHRIREWGITESESMREAWREFREVTDPIEVWLEANVIEDPTAFTSKNTLVSAYNASAEASGRPIITKKSFTAALRQWKPDLEDAQRTIHTKVQWCWLGIGLRKNGEIGKESEENSKND